MSEPTKALLVVLGVLAVPVIGFVLYASISERNKFKNAIHVDFKKSNGNVKGYVKNKNGAWKHEESLQLEDDVELNDEDRKTS